MTYKEIKELVIQYIQENVGVYNKELCEEKYMETVLDLVHEELSDELLNKKK